MFKKLLLFSFLIISTISQAETLFYNKDGSPIAPQEHEILYKIMLETQFPMSIMYGQYADDEIKAMNEKIKAQLPNSGIEATFIPTTLYELFVFNFIYENIEAQKLSQEIGFFSREIKLPVLQQFSISQFKTENKRAFLIYWHMKVNNYILSSNDLPLSSEKSMKLARELVNKLVIQPLPIRPVVADMNRAIAIEYNAFARNQFVLYRGSHVIDDYHDIRWSQNRSISFGNSLFGGCFCDITGMRLLFYC